MCYKKSEMKREFYSKEWKGAQNLLLVSMQEVDVKRSFKLWLVKFRAGKTGERSQVSTLLMMQCYDEIWNWIWREDVIHLAYKICFLMQQIMDECDNYRNIFFFYFYSG